VEFAVQRRIPQLIFVDTNVLMYAVGRAHPLRSEARHFFERAVDGRLALYTSAEVLQELLRAYLPVGRLATLDDALELCHFAVCRRRGVKQVRTFDRGLAAIAARFL